jgi:hypothetical protein
MIIGAKQKIPNTGELKLHLMSGSRVFSVKPWGGKFTWFGDPC